MSNFQVEKDEEESGGATMFSDSPQSRHRSNRYITESWLLRVVSEVPHAWPHRQSRSPFHHFPKQPHPRLM